MSFSPSNVLRVVRRGKFRYFLLTGIAISLVVLLYQGFGGNLRNVNVSVPSSYANDFKNNLDAQQGPGAAPPQSRSSGVGETGKGQGLTSLLWQWSSSRGASSSGSSSKEECPVVPKMTTQDMDTVEIYPTLNFKPLYKTYWNHSFEKRYLKQKESWRKLPLRVFVLPHSHNDPGWLKTFDGYFLSSTAFILNNMVDRLDKYRNMTFIWSEISFFAKWWDSLKNRPQLRETVKEMVNRGQLEMVTGGWVMTDEAAAHYHAMIEQLIEGHHWLKTHLGVEPRNGWSIDPFGHSSTVPYLLRESGIKNMIIQRIHFAWKQYLAERKRLEFVWKQYFDKPNPDETNDVGGGGGPKSKDVLCHMTPFDLYSIKHTCGPDTDVCLQFDFRRIAGEYSESTAVQISDDNIEEKARLILGQYGRIGSLFPHNVALVFLGDDFRFNHDVEWDQQYSNYKKLFDYINGQPELNAKVSFGTLEDYFKEVHGRMEKLEPPENFASLTGDFLPYGDIYAEARPSYWTGYFTTRPYWKHLTRELEHWLRSAEILYSLCRNLAKQRGNDRLVERLNQDYTYLSTARQSLGLFQHHDAITGTSKVDVMQDYGRRLYRGIRESIGVISHSVQYVMLKEPIKTEADLRPAHPMTSYLFPDINRPNYDSFPQKIPFSIPKIEGRKIVVFNSALHHRQQVVRVMVKSPRVKVVDANMAELPAQVNPAWNGTIEIISGVYELNFIVELAPLTLQTLTIMDDKKDDETPPETRPTVSVFVNDAFSAKPTASVFNFQNPSSEDIELESPHLHAVFCKQTGLLKELQLKSDNDVRNKMSLTFQAYKSEDFRSGAYLFQPNRMEPIVNVTGRFPVIRVVRGPILSEVHTVYPGVVSLTSRVYHVDGILGGGLELTSTFDMNTIGDANLELFMRLDTDIASENIFYTDTNGFQIMKRYNMPQLSVEANYYPITSATYIEDAKTRLSLLVSHAHGATSHKPGSMEVMLDRRLRYDDSRGLGEGVMDNKKTAAQFWLVLEKRNPSTNDDNNQKPEIPNLSLLSHTLSDTLNYPPILLVAETGVDRPMETSLSFLEGGFPCDHHLVNLRTLPVKDNFEEPSENALMIFHRRGYSCQVTSPSVPYGCEVNNNKTKSKFNGVKLGLVRVRGLEKTSLTGLRTIEKLQSLGEVNIEPMNLQSYNIAFAP